MWVSITKIQKIYMSRDASSKKLNELFTRDLAGEILTYLYDTDPVKKWAHNNYKHVVEEFKQYRKNKNWRVKLRKIVSSAKGRKRRMLDWYIVPAIKEYWRERERAIFLSQCTWHTFKQAEPWNTDGTITFRF